MEGVIGVQVERVAGGEIDVGQADHRAGEFGNALLDPRGESVGCTALVGDRGRYGLAGWRRDTGSEEERCA